MKNFYQSDYYSWLETNDPKLVKILKMLYMKIQMIVMMNYTKI
ncbi:hypothetical protein SDC49_12705 [Lactobacillus sp. R2/2]|nr:hypothetical protein [Lactobacillus sp. R2/2]